MKILEVVSALVFERLIIFN